MLALYEKPVYINSGWTSHVQTFHKPKGHKPLGFLHWSRRMDKETPEIKGWRRFKFLFGKADQEADSRIDMFLEDITINMEQIGSGCFHTVVDIDEIDSH